MKNKITALIFILLANMTLLAHAVVPHHHHNAQICVKSTQHNENKCDSHNKFTTEHKHEHDCNGNSETCVLRQAIVLPPNQFKQTERNYTSSDDSNLNEFQSIIFGTDYKIYVPIIYLSVQISIIPSSYTFQIQSAKGLRAPPIV